jgi:ubiquinone/menaquinone biosynthesis C-methylase UbiE
MSAGPATARASGRVFDDLAVEYDRWRPAYPDQLVAEACAVAGVGSGDRVLEVGCGSGQLTRSLLARGLRVVAVEPGGRLRSLAAERLRGCGELELVSARFEDAQLPRGQFRALFSAAAFHWIDPAVGWQKAAEVLAPGGTLVLIQHFGISDEHSGADQEALLAAMGRIAPEVAARWPAYRDLATTIAGVERRHGNISEAWGWLSGHDLTRACAGELFEDVEVAAVPVPLEQSADELNALARTMSFQALLTAGQRHALERETIALHERLGRPIRSSTAAVMVAARRSAAP